MHSAGNHILDQAVVLHRRPYRETSMIVDFFAFEHGRISAVVKGMRKGKSDRKSLLQPFQPLSITLSGKTDLKNLNQVEPLSASYQLQGDAMYCGFYMNELLTRVLPQGLAAESLYECYLQCLTALQEITEMDVILRQFEFALLDELGILPDLTATQLDDDVIAENFYRFESGSGITHSVSQPGAFPGQWLLDIAQHNWHDKSRQLAKHICRQALQPYLGDKPLHSRALFKRP